MTNGDPNYYSSLATDNTAGTITTGSYYHDESLPNIEKWRYVDVPTPLYQNKKGDDDMRYLYEVILVNPKNEEYFIGNVVARSEAAALIFAYNDSTFSDKDKDNINFDDLKTSCHIVFEWKKEQRTTAVE